MLTAQKIHRCHMPIVNDDDRRSIMMDLCYLLLQIILEGQEEIGSPDMAAFLTKHAKLLAADFVVSADGGQISADQGGIAIGLRGVTAFEVEAKTLDSDLHSGWGPFA